MSETQERVSIVEKVQHTLKTNTIAELGWLLLTPHCAHMTVVFQGNGVSTELQYKRSLKSTVGSFSVCFFFHGQLDFTVMSTFQTSTLYLVGIILAHSSWVKLIGLILQTYTAIHVPFTILMQKLNPPLLNNAAASLRKKIQVVTRLYSQFVVN